MLNQSVDCDPTNPVYNHATKRKPVNMRIATPMIEPNRVSPPVECTPAFFIADVDVAEADVIEPDVVEAEDAKAEMEEDADFLYPTNSH